MPYIRREKKAREAEPEAGLDAAVPHTNLLVEIPVYLLLVFTPVAIGTVHLWSATVMLGLALFSYSALAFRHARHHQHGLKLFPMGVVLLAATALTILQAIPLPPFLVRVLNPGAAEVFDHVLVGTGLWGAGNWRAVSLDPPGTALEIIKFLSYTLAFMVVVNYFNDRHRARRLMKAIAWTGFGVALIGFFSKLFVAPAILGFYPLPASAETFFFSTFVNPNHLAGYLLLCAPVAAGLALSARERQDRALYGFMAVIAGVAVFMTLSRGGIVAFVAAACFLFVFGATRRMRRIRSIAWVQAIVAVVLLVAGYLAYDTIIRELKTLGDMQALRDYDKFNSWKGSLEMMKDFPVVGIGRGAYGSVYPKYMSVPEQTTFTHAENEVLQNMVEWGPVFGLVFLGGFLLCFLLGLSRARESLSMGGCLAGVFGVGIQNLVDFNLEVGGVALSFVVVLGILSASPFSHAGGPHRLEIRPRLGRVAAVALAPLAVILALLAVPFAAAHNLNTETEALVALDKASPCEPCEECELGQASCAMLRHHPADYLAPLLLGKSYLESHPPRLDRSAHWLARALTQNPCSPVAHRLAGRALFLAGRLDQALGEYRLAAEADRGVLTATVVEVLRLTGDAQAAIRATPQEPESLLTTARILHTLGKDEAAASAARAVLEYNATRLDALDLLGDLALAAGKLTEAAGVARQAIDVDPLHDRAYLLEGEVLLRQDEPAKAEAAWVAGLDQVPDSSALAYRLGEFYLSQNKLKEAEGIAARLQNLASSDDRSQAQLHMLIGRIQEGRGMLFEARRSYRLATTLAPDVLPYLFQVGLAEEKMGNWDEAIRIYNELIQAHYQAREIKERLDLIDKARQLDKNQAMWNNWVDKKGKDEDEGKDSVVKPGPKGGKAVKDEKTREESDDKGAKDEDE